MAEDFARVLLMSLIVTPQNNLRSTKLAIDYVCLVFNIFLSVPRDCEEVQELLRFRQNDSSDNQLSVPSLVLR